MATLEARMTARPATLSFMCLLLTIVTVTVVINPTLVKAGHPPTYLVVYDHQNNIPPNNTVVESVSTNGDYSGSNLAFGSILVLADILRESIDPDSPVLGQIDGQLTFERDSFYSSVALVFDTPSYSGSVTAQGSLQLVGPGELAITGGTGDFRFARGYIVTRFATGNPGYHTVYELTLSIKYYD